MLFFGASLTIKSKNKMKTLGILFGLFLVCLPLQAQESETVTVTVTIENVLNDQGTLLVSLHDGSTFMKGPGLVDLSEQATKGAVTFTFENVTPGTYAVMAMHDSNDNKRMDYETNGMPKESYGMSGNEMTMGPPNFEDAKFEVSNEDLSLSIRF